MTTNTTNPLQTQPTLQLGAFGSNTGASAFGRFPSSAVAHGSPLFTKSTRFNDLPDDLKKTLEQIESVVTFNF